MTKFERLIAVLICAAMVLAIVPCVVANNLQDNGDYCFTDRNGNEMTIPAGAWITRVVSFEPGDPWTGDENHTDENLVMGIPDHNGKEGYESRGDLALGAGGVIVLEFGVDIYDGEGVVSRHR